MTLAGLDLIKPESGDVPSDFRCRKPEFAEYLDADAAYDQGQKMGKVYWAVVGNKVVGYTVLAMGSVDKSRQADLGIDTFGPIPALLIARLATDERYERQGVGKYMISHAFRLATKTSISMGCRIILANSEPDAVGFYEATGFTRFKDRRTSGPSAGWHASSGRPDKAAEGNGEYVPMYIDLGLDELKLSKKGGAQEWR